MTSRKPPAKLDADALFDHAVKSLAVRAASVAELKEKLRRRAQRESDVDAVVARLKDYGYLDDARFAESYAHARLENQRFGRGRVLRDLRARRVAPKAAEAAVRNLYQDVNEDELVDDYIRRKLRPARPDTLFEDEKALASAYRRLLRAGFSNGAILRGLKRSAAQPDLLDGFEPPEPENEEME